MLKHRIEGFCLSEINTMFAPVAEQRVLGLAVSGGADSLGLMLLVARWLEAIQPRPKVIVYSLDHGLRKEAADEVSFVEAAARKLGFQARGLSLGAEAKEISNQADARAFRYQTIAKAMADDDVKTLLTGHHLQDQAETVVMRLAHGSGIAGLGGMRDFSSLAGITIFRPLLGIAPGRLARLVRAAGLQPVKDPSNTLVKYERTRWRGALPALDQLGLTGKRLADFSDRMARAEAALAKMSQSLFRENVVCNSFGLWRLGLEMFEDQPAELGIRLVMELLRRASGRAAGVRLGRVEALYSRLRQVPAGAQTLAGCVVEIREKSLWVFRENSRISKAVFHMQPGEKHVWDQRFNIENTGRSPLVVKSAVALGRATAEDIVRSKIDVPMAVVRGGPLVTDQGGAPIALGATTNNCAVNISVCGT